MKKALAAILILATLAPGYSRNAKPHRVPRKQLEQQNAELQERIAALEDSLARRDTVYLTQTDTVVVKHRPAWLEEFSGPRSADEIDKRVTRYELEKRLAEFDPLAYDPSFAGRQTDEVYMQRLEAMGSPLNLPYNEVVRRFIVRYSEQNRKEMSRILGLCYYYMPMIEQTFDRYDIPLELSALAIIESNLNPRATSKVGAKGMWQFMYTAGRNLGLEIDSFVDERMDVVKSTDAAARYLRDAYRVFGDWALAISAYNCGYGNVRKAIRYAQGKTDYWSIYPYLPTETRYYVPAMVGALYTLHYHTELGIKPKQIITEMRKKERTRSMSGARCTSSRSPTSSGLSSRPCARSTLSTNTTSSRRTAGNTSLLSPLQTARHLSRSRTRSPIIKRTSI